MIHSVVYSTYTPGYQNSLMCPRVNACCPNPNLLFLPVFPVLVYGNSFFSAACDKTLEIIFNSSLILISNILSVRKSYQLSLQNISKDFVLSLPPATLVQAHQNQLGFLQYPPVWFPSFRACSIKICSQQQLE